MSIATDDGRLDEAWTGTLSSTGEENVIVHQIDDPAGTVNPHDHLEDPTDFDPEAIRLHLRFAAPGGPADAFSGSAHAVYLPGGDARDTIGTWFPDSDEE